MVHVLPKRFLILEEKAMHIDEIAALPSPLIFPGHYLREELLSDIVARS